MNCYATRSTRQSPAALRSFRSRWRLGVGLGCALALIALGGCKENGGATEPTTISDAESPVVEDVQPPISKDMSEKKHMVKDDNGSPEDRQSGSTVHSMPTELMERLVEDVARTAGVSADEVTLHRAEDVTWRDGSLGCPQPNMAYSQALVDGYWAIFRVGREEFDMRVTKRGTFMRCEGQTKQAPIRYDD